MASECENTIVFGDDFGDNICTFGCEVEAEGHEVHVEGGESSQAGEQYFLVWASTETFGSLSRLFERLQEGRRPDGQ